MSLPLEQRQLLWRCRRGMKELDLLLERFARERYTHSTEAQKRTFAQLLELPDPELADYFFGHGIPGDPAIAELTQLITTRDPA